MSNRPRKHINIYEYIYSEVMSRKTTFTEITLQENLFKNENNLKLFLQRQKYILER